MSGWPRPRPAGFGPAGCRRARSCAWTSDAPRNRRWARSRRRGPSTRTGSAPARGPGRPRSGQSYRVCSRAPADGWVRRQTAGLAAGSRSAPPAGSPRQRRPVTERPKAAGPPGPAGAPPRGSTGAGRGAAGQRPRPGDSPRAAAAAPLSSAGLPLHPAQAGGLGGGPPGSLIETSQLGLSALLGPLLLQPPPQRQPTQRRPQLVTQFPGRAVDPFRQHHQVVEPTQQTLDLTELLEHGPVSRIEHRREQLQAVSQLADLTPPPVEVGLGPRRARSSLEQPRELLLREQGHSGGA